MVAGHVGDVQWEVLDVAPDGREFFRLVDSGKKVLIEGEFDGPKIYFEVEGRDEKAVDEDREVFERDIRKLGMIDDPVDEIIHEIADDLAFVRHGER